MLWQALLINGGCLDKAWEPFSAQGYTQSHQSSDKEGIPPFLICLVRIHPHAPQGENRVQSLDSLLND